MKGLRILLVDDEEELVFTLQERLRLRDIDAEVALTAEDALAQVKQRAFDVVVLDVKLPGMGGLELMRQIKREQPSVQVILFTGHGSAKDGEDGLKEGAFDYLLKPVHLEDLIEKLTQAAGR